MNSIDRIKWKSCDITKKMVQVIVNLHELNYNNRMVFVLPNITQIRESSTLFARMLSDRHVVIKSVMGCNIITEGYGTFTFVSCQSNLHSLRGASVTDAYVDLANEDLYKYHDTLQVLNELIIFTRMKRNSINEKENRTTRIINNYWCRSIWRIREGWKNTMEKLRGSKKV